MSQWTDVEATFRVMRLSVVDIEWKMPTGSEDGPIVSLSPDGSSLTAYVSGALRDFGDYDTPSLLAWWARLISWCDEADLTIDVHGGPRYRYSYRNGMIAKMRGVLDG